MTWVKFYTTVFTLTSGTCWKQWPPMCLPHLAHTILGPDVPSFWAPCEIHTPSALGHLRGKGSTPEKCWGLPWVYREQWLEL